MAKKKTKEKERTKSSKVQPSNDKEEEEGRFRGVLPDRDLKKNLGCG